MIILFSRSYWSFRDILVILGVRGYFGHYDVSRVILVILEFSMLFWSLWCFRGYTGHIGGFGIILVILGVQYYFGHYLVFGVILVILEFSDYFYHFRGFVCILVILGVLSVFWGLFWLFLNF